MKKSNSRNQQSGKSADSSQQKISSFFQTGPPASKLFTTVRHMRPLVNADVKSQSVVQSAGSASLPCVISQMTVLKDYKGQVYDETVNEQTTPSKADSSAADASLLGSPDVLIIPDTPDDKLGKSLNPEKLRPNFQGRSFLRPIKLLTVMPGKKNNTPHHVRQKKSKQKTFRPVSVQLGEKWLHNPSAKEMVGSDSANAPGNVLDCGQNLVTEIILGEDADYSDFFFQSDITDCHPGDVKGTDEPATADKSLQNKGCSTEGDQKKDIKISQDMEAEEKGKTSLGIPTPTKPTVDGKSKRMAQSGLSPDPKRIVTDFASIDVKSSRVLNAKRQLAVYGGFKDVREMNQLVNTYQLGGSAKCQLEANISCADDTVLDDLLEQTSDATFDRHQDLVRKKAFLKSSEFTVVDNEEKALVLTADFHKMGTKDSELTKNKNKENDDVLDEILGELSQTLQQSSTTTNNVGCNRQSVKKVKLSCANKHSTLCMAKRDSVSVPNKPDINRATAFCSPFLNDATLLETDVSQVLKSGVNSSHVDSMLCSSPKASKHLRNNLNSNEPNQDILLGVSETLAEELAGSFGQLSPFKKSSPEARPKQHPVASQPQPSSRHRFTDQWNRFVVLNVHYDRRCHEKHLELSQDSDRGKQQKAILKDSWSDTNIVEGDVIHLLYDGALPADDHEMLIVSENRGHVVVNPDLLLSGTTIVSGVFCLRKSVLSEKFKGADGKNIHMLYGSVIHCLFQQVLKERLTKAEEIQAAAKSIVKSSKFLHDLYGQSVNEAKVMEEIEAYIAPLQAWMKRHVPSVRGMTMTTTAKSSEVQMVEIHDIEETIWSPRLGVKGKIDMTVEVEVQMIGGQRNRKVVPLELKTGKASHSAEHRGQVTLYSMMMSDRHQNPEEGLLLYLKHNDMSFVPVRPENVKGLLQLRNEMAYYMGRDMEKSRDENGQMMYHLGQLPPPINNLQACSKCPQLINCTLYQRMGSSEQQQTDHAMRTLVPDTLSHLADPHLDYFMHWLLCLHLEATSQRNESIRKIWCMSSAEREEQGECLQQLVMVDSVLGVPETQMFTEGLGCCVEFYRRPGFIGGPLNQAGLCKNDAVVISSEDGRFLALSTGFIKDVTESSVLVVVDRDSFHENTAFKVLVFRIDRCETFNTCSYLMTNLSRLMERSAQSQKLRSLIIDGTKPQFDLKMSKNSVEKVKTIFKPLNKPQKTAILKVLMSKDFVLIKGYPGTGKTSTIVALVKILRALGQSVLLTSYTHSAVDNILIKLKHDGVPFLRLGRTSRIHPLIQDHAAEWLTLQLTSVDELQAFYNSYAIVATSCLGTNSPMLARRGKFDVCIVDEASQVLQPACLGPLFHADRFVLVGDPLQLPPVIQNKEASELGMGESLFVKLDGAGATYDLSLQYRMNSPIMQLSNELVYGGRLKCDVDSVAQACIQPSDLSVTKGIEWLDRCLNPSIENAVVFLDTHQTNAKEMSDGHGLTNPGEVNLITCLCSTFVQAGILAEDIGVIAPYRAQVKALQRQLHEYLSLQRVEVNTVDQYQGRDKSVIFISFVRSAAGHNSHNFMQGGLLQDVRRLNVAVTRSKHKLVLVGNRATLSHYQPLSTLITNLDGRHQIYTLPANQPLLDLSDS